MNRLEQFLDKDGNVHIPDGVVVEVDPLPLPKSAAEERFVWMCDCGCATFYRYMDGSLKCSECETIQCGY